MKIFLEKFAQNTNTQSLDLKGFNVLNIKENIVFDDGLYTLLSEKSSKKSLRVLRDNKIKYSDAELQIFAIDWLGRMYGLAKNDEKYVYIFDIVESKVFKAKGDTNFFHDVILVEDNKSALDYKLFKKWHKRTKYLLEENECVSLKLPPFFGGKLEISNLEVLDIDVYWSLSSQFN